MKIIVAKDYDEMSAKAAELFIDRINKKNDLVLGLATGTTPLGLYKNLADAYKAGKVDFSKVSSFNLDEYVGVGHDNENGYYYFMYHNLFKHINIDLNNVRVENGLAEDLEAECEDYSNSIKAKGGIDLQLLGIGHDGHIGFNEPSSVFSKGTHVEELTQMTIEANSRLFNDISEVPTRALTMGVGDIFAAKEICMLVNGKGKAEILKKCLYGDIDPMVQASILQLHGNVTVICDAEAAELL